MTIQMTNNHIIEHDMNFDDRATSLGRRVFARQNHPISAAELLAKTGLVVQVESYCPFEVPVGTAIAELELSLAVSCYDLDPVDRRYATLEIHGCFLHDQNGRFWVSLPESSLSLPDAEEHAAFELAVFKDLCESYPVVVIPPALIRVTQELRRRQKEQSY
jgi:hypothetical protein